MKKRRFAWSAWLLLAIFAQVAAYSQDLPIRVEIKVAQLAVKNDDEFPVSTTIRNMSAEEQSLQIWSCSYPEQWTSDNPVVHITPASCDKNDVIFVRLKQ